MDIFISFMLFILSDEIVEVSDLVCSCQIEGRELVRILLAAGADPSAQDSQNGRTALHTAAMTNDVELVKVSE